MKTIEQIKDRLESAAYTMRLLPLVKAQGYKSCMSQIIYTPQEIALMDRRPVRPRPTQEQITQMDEVLQWLQILEPAERKLVWKRAERIPWKLLCREYGLHRCNLSKKYDTSLSKIQGFLSRQKIARHFQKKSV